MKKKVLIPVLSGSIAGALLLIAGGVIASNFLAKYFEYEEKYKMANTLLYNYDLDDSLAMFNEIIFYKDSRAKTGVIKGIRSLNQSSDYESAIDIAVNEGAEVKVNFLGEGSKVDPKIIKKAYIDETSSLDHYDFVGWKIDSYYAVPDSHQIELNLFSRFTPHLYSIEYDVAPGFIVDPVRSYKYGSEITLPNAYLDGYTFTGYTIGDDHRLYNPYKITPDMGVNLNLKAHYTANTYHYVFDAAGGETPTSEGDYVFDEIYSLPIASKPGYYFKGWYNRDGVKLTEKINIFENTTLTARYDVIQYNVEYELNGGEFFYDHPTGYNVESEPLSVPYPHKEGYMFSGWVKEGQTSKDSILDYVIETGSVGNLKLYALWSKYEAVDGNTKMSRIYPYEVPESLNNPKDFYQVSYVIPYHIKTIEDGLFTTSYNFNSFGVESKNKYFSVIGDHKECLVNKDEDILYQYAVNETRANTVVTLPDSIKKIMPYTFAANTILHRGQISGLVSYEVEEILDHAFFHSVLTELNTPNVTYFGEYAFAWATSLSNVHDSLLKAEYVGDYAFQNTSLESVTLGNELVYLGEYSFARGSYSHSMTSFECRSTKVETMRHALAGQVNITNIKFSKITNSIYDMFETFNVGLLRIVLSGVDTIPDGFLDGISSFNELVIDTDIIHIGSRAFAGTRAQFIPALSHVNYIGFEAFEGCENLTSVSLSESLTYLGDRAFKDSGILSITLPASLEYIGEGIISGCKNLKKLVFGSPSQCNLVKDILGGETFDENFTIEVNGSGYLPKNAFAGIRGVKKIVLGDDVKLSIASFKDATSVQEIVFGNANNTIIPNSCFENATSLKSVNLTGVTKIGLFAFNNCVSLLSIISEKGVNYLPDTLFEVERVAFGNLKNIPSLHFEDVLTTFKEEVFYNDSFNVYFAENQRANIPENTFNMFFGDVNYYN